MARYCFLQVIHSHASNIVFALAERLDNSTEQKLGAPLIHSRTILQGSCNTPIQFVSDL